MKNIAVAIHIHDHGSDGYIFAFESRLLPSEDQVVKSLGINYEPNRDEHLEISYLTGVRGQANDMIDPERLPFVKNQ